MKDTTEVDIKAAEWHRKTEHIIAGAGLAFSLILFALYFVSNQSANGASDAYLTQLAIILFTAVCAARMFYVYKFTAHPLFGWISAAIDVSFLSAIIFLFSEQYGTAAATLQSPSFTYYFVLLALHAIRFNASLVLAMGAVSALAWSCILTIFLFSGAERTHSYATYVSSTDVLVGAEVEKIFAILVFTVMLGMAVKRADKVVKDASARHFAEVRMLEAEKTAQMKTEFLANMSHEIRTPMNGVLGMTQILQTTELDEHQKEYAATIQRSGDALLTIINDILDFSKIEAGKLRLDRAQFNLREACEDVTTLLGVTAREKGIELILNIDADVPVNLIGDAGRVRQILTNLIGNAIKFTEAGHVLIDVKGVVAGYSAKLTFAIQDTGIGIHEDKLANIFSEFSQADNSTTRRFGGTGLGLSISKNLVKLMNGDIKVHSEFGKGSTFTFNIELSLDRRSRLPKAGPDIVDLSNTRILIVDDLEVNSGILRLQLTHLGAITEVASSAREAVAKIIAAYKAGLPYTAVVTDYQMPDIDGLDFVKALRKREQFDALQVIVLSSIDNVKIKRDFETLNIVSYMTKPCRAGDLHSAIYTAVARYRDTHAEQIVQQPNKAGAAPVQADKVQRRA